MLFVGQAAHSLDPKGRVVLPAAHRAAMSERGYIAKADGCIALWPEVEFEKVVASWNEDLEAGRMSKHLHRELTRHVSAVRLDSAGRVTLPRELLDGLEFETQVVITGAVNRVEIWPQHVFHDKFESDDARRQLAQELANVRL